MFLTYSGEELGPGGPPLSKGGVQLAGHGSIAMDTGKGDSLLNKGVKGVSLDLATLEHIGTGEAVDQQIVQLLAGVGVAVLSTHNN